MSTEAQKHSRALVLQSMVLALSLAGLKIAAGLAANSLALLASALDSGMDFLSSFVNYMSLGWAAEPADDDHHYGHDKIEALAGAGQGLLIGLSGLALLVESIRRVVESVVVSSGPQAIGVMVLSMVASIIHGTRLRRHAEETDSPVLKAEGLHFSMDVLANLGVILALGVIYFGGTPAWDVLISLIVAGYVVKEALTLLNGSAQQLMDRALSDEKTAEIEDLIRTHHPAIVGFHDLRTRKAGVKTFIDCHIEIRGIDKFTEAHDITEGLVDKIKERITNADVTIHYDPEGAD
jgi:ferrous-iron efflux pump FieF